MRNRYHYSSNQFPVANTADLNERFVVSRCSLYLKRLLSRYPRIDEHSLTFSVWLLGRSTELFADFLMNSVKKSGRVEMSPEWSDEGCDFYDADYLHALYKRLSQGKRGQAVKLLISLLDKRHAKLDCSRQSDLSKNFQKVKASFSLTENETEYSIFQLIVAGWSYAYDFFYYHLDVNDFKSRSYLMAALNYNVRDMEDVLHGTLRKISLIDNSGMDITVDNEMLEYFTSIDSGRVSENLFTPLKSTDLPLHYHMVGKTQADHVLALLKNKPGGSSHILVYGPPGTGKTTFVKAISKKIRSPFFEVMRGDERNASTTRRAAILASLNMTNTGKGSVIVVDEADNILDTGFSWMLRGETQDKGWLNELLEMPGVRMIWITNRITGIEDSVLRRFKYSLQFKPFTRRQRMTLWNNILETNGAQNRLSQPEVRELATEYKLSAGAVSQAVETAVNLKKRSKKAFKETIRLTLDSHRTLLNGGSAVRNKEKLDQTYSIEGLNAEGDLKGLVSQVKAFDHNQRKSNSERRGNMSLLFYGPPGTGKSELARYLAHTIDREVLVKKASDILNPYVGGTEANINQAFEEAEAEDAVLVIDEVDSFLFNRKRAVRSWEISFTNEFLSQMERFEGILIGTTNLMTDLDHASIRRFNIKMKLNYLKPEGNLVFYERMLSKLTKEPLGKGVKERVAKITQLAPGDFSIVRKRFSFFSPEKVTHKSMVKALEAEARIKKVHQGRKKIGF